MGQFIEAWLMIPIAGSGRLAHISDRAANNQHCHVTFFIIISVLYDAGFALRLDTSPNNNLLSKLPLWIGCLDSWYVTNYILLFCLIFFIRLLVFPALSLSFVRYDKHLVSPWTHQISLRSCFLAPSCLLMRCDSVDCGASDNFVAHHLTHATVCPLWSHFIYNGYEFYSLVLLKTCNIHNHHRCVR